MKDTITEEEQIEEILTEAHAHNLRNEVKTTAQMFLKDDNLLCPIAAHNAALLQWVEIQWL